MVGSKKGSKPCSGADPWPDVVRDMPAGVGGAALDTFVIMAPTPAVQPRPVRSSELQSSRPWATAGGYVASTAVKESRIL
jgi:hypothetical protein